MRFFCQRVFCSFFPFAYFFFCSLSFCFLHATQIKCITSGRQLAGVACMSACQTGCQRLPLLAASKCNMHDLAAEEDTKARAQLQQQQQQQHHNHHRHEHHHYHHHYRLLAVEISEKAAHSTRAYLAVCDCRCCCHCCCCLLLLSPPSIVNSLMTNGNLNLAFVTTHTHTHSLNCLSMRVCLKPHATFIMLQK